MTVARFEDPPADAPIHEGNLMYGGSLFHHQEKGISGCPKCGWTGVPIFKDSIISTYCPECDAAIQTDIEWDQFKLPKKAVKVPRNQQCPCGSGVKAKKCDCKDYCV